MGDHFGGPPSVGGQRWPFFIWAVDV
jgi:hypothetical protein